MQIDVEGAIAKAYAAGREGSFLSRGWRKLTGTKIDTKFTVPVTINHLAVRSFVENLGRQQAKQAVDAALDITLTKVQRRPRPSPAAGWPPRTRSSRASSAA